MDFNRILEEITHHVRPHFGKGQVADYISGLAGVPGNKFGMAIRTVDGEYFQIGDAEERFSIQSISKVFTLSLAMGFVGEGLWGRVGREPSGNPFNSLVQLEYEHGIPRNPLINAGALIVCDVLLSHTQDAKQAVLDYMRALSGASDIGFDEAVARSEAETGFINAALANFLKGQGNLENDTESVLDVYFHQCSLAMSCGELSCAALHLANGGVSPLLDEAVLTREQTKRINAIMLTCGLYDA